MGLFDTKGGQTAEASKEKAESLQKYIDEQNKNGNKLWGGIVIQSSGQWLLNKNSSYEYNSKDLSDWEGLNI